MVSPDSTEPEARPAKESGAGPPGEEPVTITREIRASEDPAMTLRGAVVDVDIRRAGRVVIAIGLAVLAALIVVLFLAGEHRNAQINRLRHHGVPVDVTVTGCLGLMGGSGSNLVGYQCRGTYMFAGHRYDEAIPGVAFHAPGARLPGITVAADPALFTTAGTLATEHASARVFVLPLVLFGVEVLLAGAVLLRRRHFRRAR
ncbi:MAG: hypothetical protein ACYCV7_05465 [Acidimicrobiales bacterium]